METLASRLLKDLELALPSFETVRLIAVGAEAALFLGRFHNLLAVAKYRYPKLYRARELDIELRKRRTAKEAKLLARALTCGVAVPVPMLVDKEGGLLVMEYVKGPRLKEVLDKGNVNVREVFRLIGVYIGRLHEAGIVHGDLTTSNVILSPGGPVLIDFGLGDFIAEDEARGVDLHLFLRALESTHPSLAQRLFREVMEGYEEVRGGEARISIEEKVREIRMRGRYVAERRKKLLKGSRVGGEGAL